MGYRVRLKVGGAVERIAGVAVVHGSKVDLGGIWLEGQSLGGIRTCLELPALKLIVDLGSVDHSQVYANTVLVTHGHMDHLGGMPAHMALREMMGREPAQYIVPPAIVEPVKRMLTAWRELDGSSMPGDLIGLAPGEILGIQKKIEVEPFATRHRVASQGYLVRLERSQLNQELQGVPSEEIASLVRAGQQVSHPVQEVAFAFTGDTTIEGLLANPQALSAKRLVMDATFMDERVTPERARSMGHVHLEQIVEHASAFQCEQLVLTHVSLRYTLADAAKIVADRLPPELVSRVLLF